MSCPITPNAPTAPQATGVSSQPASLQKLIAVASAQEVITDDVTYFQKATFWAISAFGNFTADGQSFVSSPVGNTSAVEIGFVDEDDATIKLPRVLQPGTAVVIEAPVGQKYDLSSMAIKGPVVGDGVFVEYS